MRLTRLFVVSMFVGSVFAACGGDDGSSQPIDAPIVVDVAIDAPAVQKLGKVCNATMTCPAEAPDCITVGAGATSGFCSILCHANAQFMTNAATPPGIASSTNLTADNALCTAQFVGPGGVASCFLPVGRTPAGALQPNTTYTFQAYCAIQCGTGTPACPTGLTCDTGTMLCKP